MQHKLTKTPIGELMTIYDDAGALCALEFGGTARGPTDERLIAYFDRQPDAFDGLDVDPDGTEFQRLVWDELRRIPFGTTISYGELAKRIGRPKASRAVGLANSKNPISIVIPCHRVIGANGKLTGYAGGLELKRWLLCHEGANLI